MGTSSITYRYTFRMDSADEFLFDVNLNSYTLAYMSAENQGALPVEAEAFPCDTCPLKGTEQVQCPVAANIYPLANHFSDNFSYDKVDVLVESETRTIINHDISLQKALSSLLGIIMSTSGCPDLDPLRPMVLLHLPFASVEETTFRAVSTYLLAQYMRQGKGLQPDWNLEKLVQIYRRIEEINQHFSAWLRKSSNKDASPNALIILDTFAKLMPKSIASHLAEFEHLFDQYLT